MHKNRQSWLFNLNGTTVLSRRIQEGANNCQVVEGNSWRAPEQTLIFLRNSLVKV